MHKMALGIKEAEQIIHHFIREIKDAPASMIYHLNRRGGLLTHLNNVANIAKNQFPDDENLIALGLVHDIGKARIYRFVDNFITVDKEKDHVVMTLEMIKEAGYNLTEDEVIAIQMHHGGWSPYKIDMNELSVRLHYCDMIATIREKENMIHQNDVSISLLLM